MHFITLIAIGLATAQIPGKPTPADKEMQLISALEELAKEMQVVYVLEELVKEATKVHLVFSECRNIPECAAWAGVEFCEAVEAHKEIAEEVDKNAKLWKRAKESIGKGKAVVHEEL